MKNDQTLNYVVQGAFIDIHAKEAARIFNKSISEVTEEERRQAKAINYGVIYGNKR